MKKRLIIGAAVVGAVVLARRMFLKCGGSDWAAMIERMPDNAPPKWMFRNIAAIRENTDRILEKLGATPDTGEANGESEATSPTAGSSARKAPAREAPPGKATTGGG
ncbi:MAG: hypothetical protein ACM3ML_35590 [Micromonosporaceae bacterium]